jgi:hypothetical protein
MAHKDWYSLVVAGGVDAFSPPTQFAHPWRSINSAKAEND